MGKIKDEPKLFWKYVRSKAKTKEKITQLDKGNGELTINDHEKADVLNNHFASVFVDEGQEPLPQFQDHSPNSKIHRIIITEDKIVKAIGRLKANKAAGPDNIHPKFLKETADQIKVPLRIIFEKSMTGNRLVKSWKHANVTPIFKKGNKKDPGNYRPISITSLVGKLLQRIIRDVIVDHLDTNNLVSTEQHGFRSGKSCTTQLLEAIDDWTEAIDQNKQVDVIYLDYKKAFDKVPHKRLLHKIKGYGIDGDILGWITDFLTDMEQEVVINGCESHTCRVTSGVPQGSVLGPVLFLIYINDLPEVIHNLTKMFADDTKIYRAVNTDDQGQNLQEDLHRLNNWTRTWMMELNSDKCKHLKLYQGTEKCNTSYSIVNQGIVHELQSVASENDLGVTIDTNLKFSKHVNLSVAKANRNVGMIFRTFSCINKEMFATLYKSLVRPYLETAVVVWSPMLTKDIKSIENVQRRATKLVPGIKDLSYPERLKALGLPTMEYRRLRSDMVQTYKLINKMDNIKDGFLKINQTRMTRGHTLKLEKTRYRTNLRGHSFKLRVVNNWNSLSDQVVNAPSLFSFKSRLNKYWRAHPNKFEPSFY